MTTTTPTHPVRRAARPLVALAVLLGAVLTGASPADAATPRTGLLSVYTSTTPGEHCFRVEGHLPMTQYDAQGFIDNGAVVGAELWGEDPSYDDLLIGPKWGDGTYRPYLPAIHASSRGLEVRWWACTPSSTLDEDWGGDELYADVAVYGGGGYGLIGYFETHRVYGNF